MGCPLRANSGDSGRCCSLLLGTAPGRARPGYPLTPSRAGRTEHNEPGVCVSGAQGVLGCAAVHGAVELGGNSLQHKLLPVELGAAIQEAAPDPCPREHGLREDFVLLARADESPVTGGTFRPEQEGVKVWPGQGWQRTLEEKGSRAGKNVPQALCPL